MHSFTPPLTHTDSFRGSDGPPRAHTHAHDHFLGYQRGVCLCTALYIIKLYNYSIISNYSVIWCTYLAGLRCCKCTRLNTKMEAWPATHIIELKELLISL